jgi:hypothetical protein
MYVFMCLCVCVCVLHARTLLPSPPPPHSDGRNCTTADNKERERERERARARAREREREQERERERDDCILYPFFVEWLSSFCSLINVQGMSVCVIKRWSLSVSQSSSVHMRYTHTHTQSSWSSLTYRKQYKDHCLSNFSRCVLMKVEVGTNFTSFVLRKEWFFVLSINWGEWCKKIRNSSKKFK